MCRVTGIKFQTEKEKIYQRESGKEVTMEDNQNKRPEDISGEESTLGLTGDPKPEESAAQKPEDTVLEQESGSEMPAEETTVSAEAEETVAAEPAPAVPEKKKKGGLIAILALAAVAVACAIYLAVTLLGGKSDKLFQPTADEKTMDYNALKTVSAAEYVLEDGTFDYEKANLSDYVQVCDYTKLTVYLQPFQEITDEDVANTIEEFLAGYAVLTAVDREAKEGDTLTLSLTGYLDGEAFEGSSVENTNLVLGSGEFLDEIETGLVGVKAGEHRTITATMAANAGDIAGKEVVFEIDVHGVSESVLPELTDEFVTENTNCQTVDEYKAAVREELETANTESYEAAKRAIAWNTLIANCKFKALPAEMVDYYVNYYTEYYASMASLYQTYYGWDQDTFYAYMGISEEGIAQQAKQYTCEDLVYYSLKNRPSLTLTDEEYHAGLEKYLEQYNVDEETFFAQYADEAMLRMNLTYNKIVDTILETADFKISEAE